MGEERIQKMEAGRTLPAHWSTPRLADVATINPRVDKSALEDETEVSFVPMSAVEAESGRIDVSETRYFFQVKKGYTSFLEGDVLFAKITPCMENGKMAVVPKLKNGMGFGSTEFHVIRAGEALLPKYIYYFVSSKQFRVDAERKMTGAVGQKRVPVKYLENAIIPTPPLNEQKDIIAKIGELFSELDKSVESLKIARTQLKIYRQALLKHAFEGRLTAQWRKENADKLETPEQLLARIQQERQARYQQQLDNWKHAVKEWGASGQYGKKPGKPTTPITPKISIEYDFEVPREWMILEFGALAYECVLGKMLDKQKNTGEKRPYLGNINVRWGAFELTQLKLMKIENSEVERYALKKGDLVICEGGEPGRCAVWEGEDNVLFIQKALHRVRFTDAYRAKFAFYYLMYSASLERVVKNFTGTTIKHLTGVGLGRIQFPVCSSAEQDEIVERLEAKLSLVDAMEREISLQLSRAENLHQSILKKAFSGQLLKQDAGAEPAADKVFMAKP